MPNYKKSYWTVFEKLVVRQATWQHQEAATILAQPGGLRIDPLALNIYKYNEYSAEVVIYN
jgi:hypothetical protein